MEEVKIKANFPELTGIKIKKNKKGGKKNEKNVFKRPERIYTD